MTKKRKYTGKKLTNEEKAAKLTARILAQMEEGEPLPWHKPWNVLTGIPRNFSSKKAYSGVNMLLLAMAGFESPHFMGFGQARDMGGHVRKGEKGTTIFRPFTFIKKEDRAIAEANGKEPKKTIGFATESVFNASQIEGIDFPQPAKIEFNRIEAAEKLSAHMIGAMGIKVVHGMRQPGYVPSLDQIEMPTRENFHSEEHYYSTLFHELAHATGHKDRLDRNLTADRTDERYGVEELRAEMTANFLRSLVGIEHQDQDKLSLSYLQAWKDRIEADPEMFIAASKDAFEITEYLTRGFDLEQEVDVTHVEPNVSEEPESNDGEIGILPPMENSGKAALGLPDEDEDEEEKPRVMLENPHVGTGDVFGRKELVYSYLDTDGKLHDERMPLFASEAAQMERYMTTFQDPQIEATELPIGGLDSLKSHDIEEGPTLEAITEDPELIPELPEAKEEQIGVGEVDLDV